MHRDLKLGLALAVLLIGSTTAFFFRSDADPEAGLPRLQDPERLDGELADRDVIPYLGPPESELEVEENPWAKPAFLEGAAAAVVRRTSATPDPIRILVEEEAETSDPASPPPAAPLRTGPETDEAGRRYHVIRSGDTLTGLAAMYLGSLARYGEIFELNRDQLEGPHSLRVGMKLRIPSAERDVAVPSEPVAVEPETAAAANPAAPVTDAETQSPGPESAKQEPVQVATPADATSPQVNESASAEPAAEKLFVPAKRTPFVPSRYRAPKQQ
ncbi:MAG TPA: LysM peptidoglycan-binding domain-containing protein [Planctomycetaceae bacterium]